ncbi:UDP-4-amino-4,6-dideoxy-N-acetyl-beta-L-altrosamine N-acetyltransferase [Oceanospirillaceae bacterium]|nr:UDP-4-amino-4,6-dideoxy-N-acetyl-beta-L-altrosamine N-acetyltransferase [Oceanospirillaceae bacterium]
MKNKIKLEFRVLDESDLPVILKWRNVPEVRKNMYTSHQISMDEHQAWFDRLKSDASQKYFIAQRDGIAVGVVSFSKINHKSKIAAWAFYASPTAPRGTGSLMEYRALEYAFINLGLHKLQCEVLAFNKLVVKLHQKFSFEVEGVHRDAFYDGTSYHDIVHLGMLRHEWDKSHLLMKENLGLA